MECPEEDARLFRLIRASLRVTAAPRVFVDLREAGEKPVVSIASRLIRENSLRALTVPPMASALLIYRGSPNFLSDPLDASRVRIQRDFQHAVPLMTEEIVRVLDAIESEPMRHEGGPMNRALWFAKMSQHKTPP